MEALDRGPREGDRPAEPDPQPGRLARHQGVGPFTSTEQAYETLHIGDPAQAAKLQAESRK